ncbi:MAG: ADP-ribosylglycohydrolase family protein [Candidatus Woesearchaeota archaeon]
MKAETKYKGSIKLSAIGDALGWITEFEKSKSDLKNKYSTDYIESFHDWEKQVGGRFHGYLDHIKAGSYSDDTQLLLSVARSIQPDGSIDKNYFSKVELPYWLEYSRGAGRTIKNAARKIKRKSAEWNNNFFNFKVGKNYVDYRDSGANGAAMRILPITLANLTETDKIKEEIFANSIVTHGHPRAILGAMVYGISVDTIIRYKPDIFDYKSFLTMIGKNFHDNFAIPFIEKPEYQNWLNQWNTNNKIPFLDSYYKTLSEAQAYLRDIYKFQSPNITDHDALKKLGCFDPKTKGSGISTVMAGIYFATKYASEPIKGIEKAVNAIGTDTDSIAAFTGGLLGGLHGHSIIPKKWKNVQDADYLDNIAKHLLEISEDRAKSPRSQEYSNLKTISDINDDIVEEDEKIYFKPLGVGKIKNIDRQKTLKKGQYNLILEIEFEIGQSCIFPKLLKSEEFPKEKKTNNNFPIESLNINSKTQKRIYDFMNKLDGKDKMEFLDIIKKIKEERG